MTKTITFAMVHFSVAFAVGYLMTGSVLVGGAIAMVEPAINTVAYHIHEIVWKRINAKKHNGNNSQPVDTRNGGIHMGLHA